MHRLGVPGQDHQAGDGRFGGCYARRYLAAHAVAQQEDSFDVHGRVAVE